MQREPVTAHPNVATLTGASCKPGQIQSREKKNSTEEDNKMKKYEVNFTDYETGATSTIHTIVKPDGVIKPGGYTAEQYVADCKECADNEWNDMLSRGMITLTEIV